MNLVEIWIKHIYSEEEIEHEWDDVKRPCVRVDLETNCYGNVKRETRDFIKSDWEIYKKQGYWMG